MARVVIETKNSSAINKLGVFERRIQQIKQVLSSPDFETGDSIFRRTVEEISTPEECKHLAKLVNEGFTTLEAKLAVDIERLKRGALQILIVGCGMGREAFAFERRGHKVTAIDFSDRMVEEADALRGERVSKVQFVKSQIQELSQSFDLIWFTDRSLQLIPGPSHRVSFLKQAKERLGEGGHLIVAPVIKSFFGKLKLTWCSQLLKFRWRNTDLYSPGDLAEPRRIDRPHSNRLIYTHYYPHKEDVVRELAAGGWKLKSESGLYWVLGD